MPDDLSSLPDLDALRVTIDDDGGVTIDTPPPESTPDGDPNFGENLAEKLPDGVLMRVAEDVLQGIEADIQSRSEFIDNLTEGMDLLGLKIEKPKTGSGTSRVRHPVLLESVIRSQSTARAELLPSGGPAKVQIIGDETDELEQMAQDMETDLNWYLTTGAPEYYPDMDRGLFSLFFSGNLFKKVYEHPLRRRPVSECINVEDLIVSEDATDLATAIRVTHRSEVAPSEVRRMQLGGFWRDVELGTATPADDPATQKKDEITGIMAATLRAYDTPHEIYECTTDLDFANDDWGETGQPEGLPIPYIVTIDKSSRQVLAIRRGWKEGDEEFQRREQFVHYSIIPAMGFLALGYVHILGNQARTLTALWRILIDAGMFSNFPGGIKPKQVRMSTNEIQPGPGEWIDVDVPVDSDLSKSFMPLPYKGPDPTLFQMAQAIGSDANRLASVPEMEVGEGRTNIPVGTMMSQIEQATQNMAAVHKRLHTAQARELQLLKECFAENPEALARLNPNPSRQWSSADEFKAVDLVPASDPNIPAQVHRIMRSTALVTLLTGPLGPLLDPQEILRDVLRNVGVGDIDRFIKPVGPGGPPPPDPKAMAMMQANQLKAQGLQLQAAKLQADTQDRTQQAQTDREQNQQQIQSDTMKFHSDAADRQADLQSDAIKEQTEQLKIQAQAHDAAQDRAVQATGLALDHHRAVREFGHQQAMDVASHGLAVKQADTAAKAAKSAARKPKPKANKR